MHFNLMKLFINLLKFYLYKNTPFTKIEYKHDHFDEIADKFIILAPIWFGFIKIYINVLIIILFHFIALKIS